MQHLLVCGKRKEALQCAQVGQLWGPALVLAAQLGEKVCPKSLDSSWLKFINVHYASLTSKKYARWERKKNFWFSCCQYIRIYVFVPIPCSFMLILWNKWQSAFWFVDHLLERCAFLLRGSLPMCFLLRAPPMVAILALQMDMDSLPRWSTASWF